MNYSEHVAANDLLNSPTARGTVRYGHLIELNDEA
jgi:hypothetical protein